MKYTGLLHIVIISNHDSYEICVESKYIKNNIKERESQLLEIIYSDLVDLKNNLTSCSKKSYITFIDDYSRYIVVYLLRFKDETLEMFLKDKFQVENQINMKIKRSRLDRFREYELKQFNKFSEQHGITHVTTPLYHLDLMLAGRKIKYSKIWWLQCLVALGHLWNCGGQLHSLLVIFKAETI